MRAGQGEGEEVGSVVASGRVLFSDGSGDRRFDSVASSQLACFFKTINALVSGKEILERMGKSVKLEGMGDNKHAIKTASPHSCSHRRPSARSSNRGSPSSTPAP